MKRVRYSIIFIVVVLTGCAIGQMVLNVDPALHNNAIIHEVHTPSAVAFKRSFSFGEYRVDGDSIWVKSTIESSSTNGSFMDALLGNDESRTVTKKKTGSHSYQFHVGEDVTWDVSCGVGSEQLESESGKRKATAVFSYRYVCEYTRPDHEPWYLSLERGGGRGLVFQLTNQQMSLSTEVTYGDILYKDGSRRDPISPFVTGYTWLFDNKKVGAVSVYESPRRVWLAKDNSKAVNDALAMGSAGILMYYWKIGP